MARDCRPARPVLLPQGGAVRLVFVSVERQLANLAHNLAIAGALCRAFALGDRWGFWTSDPYDCSPQPWRPNVDGKAAP